MSRPYEILEHTADLKIRVQGKTLPELFANALKGMFQAAHYQAEKNSPLNKRKIVLSSFNLPSLLVDFLSEALYLSETHKEVYPEIEIKSLTEKKLTGNLIGQKLAKMGVHLKAVTYHDLSVVQDKNGLWQATLLFDI